MGALIRYTLLKAQPDAIQAMFFDEGFNTLSDDTIVAMRDYFDAFKEDVLIVGIEQHNTMFQGLDRTVYRAVKGKDKVTVIRKEEEIVNG
jgi:DNA repair exonuclease SbcCD ATPase subunit